MPVDRYDPSEVDERPSSSHITRKDAIKILIALTIIGVLLWPIYLVLLGDRDQHLCVQNLKGVYQAITLYAVENDDRFPPVYEQDLPTYSPSMFNGRPYTWVSLVSKHMGSKVSFLCPTASEAETVQNESPEGGGKSIPSSYGMYAPWSGQTRYSAATPTESILLAETSNSGANDTYNPKPFKDAKGNVVPHDGFHIGLDSSNFTPLDSALADIQDAKGATRLALPDTKSGNFKPKGKARHDTLIYGISVDGSLVILDQAAAKVQRIGNKPGADIIGPWRTH